MINFDVKIELSKDPKLKKGLIRTQTGAVKLLSFWLKDWSFSVSSGSDRLPETEYKITNKEKYTTGTAHLVRGMLKLASKILGGPDPASYSAGQIVEQLRDRRKIDKKETANWEALDPLFPSIYLEGDLDSGILSIKATQRSQKICAGYLLFDVWQEGENKGFHLIGLDDKRLNLSVIVTLDGQKCGLDEVNQIVDNYRLLHPESEKAVKNPTTIAAEINRLEIPLLEIPTAITGRQGVLDAIDGFIKEGEGNTAERFRYVCEMGPSAVESIIYLWKVFGSLVSAGNSCSNIEGEKSRSSLLQAKLMHASLLRTNGRFEDAQQILISAIEQISQDEKRDGGGFANIGFLLYENGYLLYLQGNYAEAIASFQKSSEIDFGRGDEIGGAISVCVEFRFRYLTGTCTDKEFWNILDRMSGVFKRRSVAIGSKHASRWVWNCSAHQLEVAFDSGNKALAEIAVREIHDSSYHKADDSLIKIYDGIYALTVEQFDRAIEYLTVAWEMQVPAAGEIKVIDPEEQSRLPFYIGKAYEGLGNFAEARRYFAIGAHLPERPGNHVWKSRSRSALRLLTFR